MKSTLNFEAIVFDFCKWFGDIQRFEEKKGFVRWVGPCKDWRVKWKEKKKGKRERGRKRKTKERFTRGSKENRKAKSRVFAWLGLLSRLVFTRFTPGTWATFVRNKKTKIRRGVVVGGRRRSSSKRSRKVEGRNKIKKERNNKQGWRSRIEGAGTRECLNTSCANREDLSPPLKRGKGTKIYEWVEKEGVGGE